VTGATGTTGATGVTGATGAAGTTGATGVGITQSYIGYNTTGGTTDAIGAGSWKQVYKKVTLAAAAQLLSIEAYIKGNASNVQALGVVVLDDNAAVPGKVIGIAGGQAISAGGQIANLAMSTVARWVAVPIGIYLPAGTYWIGIMSGNGITLHYDGSGADYTQTTAVTWNQAELTAPASSTRTYSIRGNILS
jgi:hypothetical protein